VTVNPFVHLNKQFIAGEWRDGSTTRVLTDRNPYNDKPICELKLASRADLDQAYHSAAAAQKT
jgi:acyl-CoA reductase-like NAD-dependent aldehyde dehydrogenase